MPEGANVEIAHKLSEDEHPHAERHDAHRLIELGEVAILAIVAVATAWSGFQAARWDGQQSLLYGQANRYRFQADAASTYAGQELAADASMFTAWLQAHSAGDEVLMSQLSNRFTPDYRAAFDSWLALDPFNDPAAPKGPAAMTTYHNPYLTKAAKLNARASTTFEDGTHARETGEKYVRDTVLFAMVLFLVAVAQRLTSHTARLAANGIAVAVLVFTLASVATLPRA